MSMGNANQAPDAAFEPLTVSPCAQVAEVETFFGEQLPRQPASTLLKIFPDIFEDVGHLQALAEGCGQGHQGVVIFGDGRGMEAKQAGQHLPHHPGDIVAILIELNQALQSLFIGPQLKLPHAVSHDSDTALQRFALRRRKASGDAQHTGNIADKLMLGRQCLARERRAQLSGKRLGVARAV